MKESITLKPSITNVYLCSWNGVGITDVFVQIHTKETLYNEYKDTFFIESNSILFDVWWC